MDYLSWISTQDQCCLVYSVLWLSCFLLPASALEILTRLVPDYSCYPPASTPAHSLTILLPPYLYSICLFCVWPACLTLLMFQSLQSYQVASTYPSATEICSMAKVPVCPCPQEIRCHLAYHSTSSPAASTSTTTTRATLHTSATYVLYQDP